MKKQAEQANTKTGLGNVAGFWLALSSVAALGMPSVLRALFFMSKAEGLAPSLQGAITLVTFLCVWVFLCLALLTMQKKEKTFDFVLYKALCTGLYVGPGIYLELALFRAVFAGNLFPDPIWKIVISFAIAIVLAHTEYWIYAIIDSEEQLFPSGQLWMDTWKRTIRKPLWNLSPMALNWLLLWVGSIVFSVLTRTVFAKLSHSIAGFTFVVLLFAAALLVIGSFALSFSFRVYRRQKREADKEKKREDTEDSLYKREKNTMNLQTENPGSAEEYLVEHGLLPRETAYEKPESYLTDEDIPVPETIHEKKWTLLDGVPLAVAICLILFLIVQNTSTTITPDDKVNSILATTREAVEYEQKHGDDFAAAGCYYDGVSDLTAFDAFLTAIAGGVGNDEVNEETSQISYYVHLFDEAQTLASGRALPYLLEAKLLLLDHHPAEAAMVLEEFLVNHPDENEAYLLLLQSYKESGQTETEAYKQTRKTCVARRIFTDTLSYMDGITIPLAESVSKSIQTPKDRFYLEGRLLEWDYNRRVGNTETAYNGLYVLLTENEGKYANNLRVLRAFVEVGETYHVRADGTTDMIGEYYDLTAEKALEYDQLATVALAAGEQSDYTLLEIKEFVASALVSCKQYVEACNYLNVALGRFPNSQPLKNLFLSAYMSLPDESKGDYNPYRWMD